MPFVLLQKSVKIFPVWYEAVAQLVADQSSWSWDRRFESHCVRDGYKVERPQWRSTACPLSK